MGNVVPLIKKPPEPRSPAAEIPPHEAIKAEGVKTAVSVAKNAGRNYMYAKDHGTHSLKPEAARLLAERQVAIEIAKETYEELMLQSFEDLS